MILFYVMFCGGKTNISRARCCLLAKLEDNLTALLWKRINTINHDLKRRDNKEN